jgi:hypothetical protein
MQNKKNGFTVVEGLLIVFVLSVVSFGGYYVWNTQKNNKTDTTTSSAKTSNVSPAPAAKAEDPYAGWKEYTLKYEKLSFKYPSTWTVQDISGGQGLTPNADNISLTSSNGFLFSVDDGWDGAGDPLKLATDSPVSVNFLNNPAYLVFIHPKIIGPSNEDPNSVGRAILMTKATSQYGQHDTANAFPQSKNAHGDPRINNGGSTMLISAGYSGSNAKKFTAVNEAKSDPEFKNSLLVLQSMHY